ncbi:MAG: relaxase domain-containing protein [Chloroflexi bacterium]|nr:relaxase domain-containing protein [Chloroflexota bacterium]
MVATVTVLGGAQSSVRYFEGDGYYVSMELEHRRASGWHGEGAAALGLRGHVYAKRFEQVLAGFVSRTRIRLGLRDGEHQHRPGLDITLSAPQSVSLEGLVFGERRVVRAHDDAVRATLDWIESDLLQTRGYDPAIRCTVHGRSAFGLSTGGGKWLIEGEVLDVRAFLVSVRITACPHDRGLRPGSVVRIPMSELVELDCARRLRDDEDERARIEADIQREIAEREEWVERHVRERDRRRGREHGRDVGWTP